MIPGMSHLDDSDVSLPLLSFFPSCGFLHNRDSVVLFATRSRSPPHAEKETRLCSIH